MKTINAGEVSKRIGVHDNTVRNWSGEYAAFLSSGAASGQRGKRRRFSEKDVLVLATIADLRNKGLKREQVIEALQSGRLIETLPAPITPAAAEARRDVELVPIADLKRALDQIRFYQEQLEQATIQRDRATERGDKVSDELNAQIADLKLHLGRAQGIVIGLILLVVALVVVVVLVVASQNPS